MEITPLMGQYRKIKAKYKDSILFFRLGDFYEMFGEDAKIGSRVLGIVLTSRQKVPMCGVPYHAVTSYLAKLIRAGYRVAICEQMEALPPKGGTKGIVKREVVRVVTPGTLTEDELLEDKKNNFLASLYYRSPTTDHRLPMIGLALADISTGEFLLTELKSFHQLKNELARFSPTECLLPVSLKSGREVVTMLEEYRPGCRNFYDDWAFEKENAYRSLCSFYKTQSLKGFGCEDLTCGISAAGAMVKYLEETQKISLRHLRPPRVYWNKDFMVIDETSQRNLELECNLRDRTKKSSLLDVLDKTSTAGGGRLLHRLLLEPLLEPEKINQRLDAVEEFYKNPNLIRDVQEKLKKTIDLERLIARLDCKRATPKDLIALKNTLEIVPRVQELLNPIRSPHPNPLPQGERIKVRGNCFLLRQIYPRLTGMLGIVHLLERALVPDPPVNLQEGGVIKEKFDAELDTLRRESRCSKDWIAKLAVEEKKRTRINSLKIGYNSVFGYYIEITRPNLKYVPANYIRKQTLVNAERFITPELKEKESFILKADERIVAREQKIFRDLLAQIVQLTAKIQSIANAFAWLDVFTTLAEVSLENHYTRPRVSETRRILIKNGRHPVVERMPLELGFVPNDTLLDTEQDQILIITGPNMAGKSTYIRQVALIVLMAQMGSFVPADQAEIGIVDRIFTRIGALDNLAQGESTFMVEMTETANILNNATPRSLIILDEIGRGTSTYDGIGIAWATVEYLSKSEIRNPKSEMEEDKMRKRFPRTLFATHYFELTELAQTVSRVKNHNFLVRKEGDRIIFLYKIQKGCADKSYGIEVAQLAGLPKKVIQRATEILSILEKGTYQPARRSLGVGGEDGVPKLATKKTGLPEQLTFFGETPHPLIEEIKKLDIEKLTPIQALNKLQELKSLLREK